MNVFAVDTDPQRAAQMLCDKHVVKMYNESLQMLDTIAGSRGYVNHPCSRWARRTRGNWAWLLSHAQALVDEHEYRFGWRRDDSRLRLYRTLSVLVPPGPLTRFVQCMPNDYYQADPVLAYRDYYRWEKLDFAKWTRRRPPAWFGVTIA